MRTVFSLFLLLLATAGSLPTPGYAEERRFLTTAGFDNLTENFQNEDIIDFKFIGKVESQTNNFLKSSVLAHLHDFFSKTNRFTNLYAQSLRKKNLEPNSWFK